MNRTDDTLAAKAVIADYIKGTKLSDPELLKSVFHENAVMAGHLGPDLLLGGPQPFFDAIAANKVGPNYLGEITSPLRYRPYGDGDCGRRQPLRHVVREPVPPAERRWEGGR